MDAAADTGRNPVSNKFSGANWDKEIFPGSADQEQDWQPSG